MIILPRAPPEQPALEHLLARVPTPVVKPAGDLADREGGRNPRRHRRPHPSHLLRHAYGDHVAKHAGLRTAQALLGHVSVDTTASTYVDKPGLDELTISVHGFTYRGSRRYPPAEHPEIPLEATTGIEPV